MFDDESFDEFYTKLNDIVNSAYNLGEIYDQPKIVRKILKSLIEDFRPKVTTITESKDVDSIPVDELVGSFKSYELNLLKTNKSKWLLSQLMMLMGMDFMMNTLLQRLHILPRTFEICLGTITEGKKVKTMLNLEILRGMNPLR